MVNVYYVAILMVIVNVVILLNVSNVLEVICYHRMGHVTHVILNTVTRAHPSDVVHVNRDILFLLMVNVFHVVLNMITAAYVILRDVLGVMTDILHQNLGAHYVLKVIGLLVVIAGNVLIIGHVLNVRKASTYLDPAGMRIVVSALRTMGLDVLLAIRIATAPKLLRDTFCSTRTQVEG